jgi:DNA-binding beta-propeller fold protein YncE
MIRPFTLALPALFNLQACSDMSFAPNAKSDEDGAWDTGYAEADGDADWDDDSDTDYGSEQEDDFLMLAPATTDLYVFVANPERDTVTRVAVPSLDVITVEVGTSPAVAVTTADYSRAVVFNEGSDDVSILDADSLDEVRIEVREHLNSMELSPDGEWVICYRDADVDEEDDGGSSGGVESYNEISLVNTSTYAHFPMVVGFNPHQVKYTAESDLALVVSDAYVALIDLLAETPTPRLVQLAEDLLDPPAAEEIEIAPDGSYAFVRQFGADDIAILDLVSHEVDRVSVGYNPTDLDITPDGTKAVVVSRGSQELWLLETADPFAPAEVVPLPEDYVLGSLLMSPDGGTGILYTTATLQDRYATWDVATGEVTVRGLVKPVQTISVSPTGESLLVFHTLEDAEGADSTSPYHGEWALTLLDLDDFRSNPMKLAAEPKAYAHADDGAHGFFIMEGEKHLVVLDYGTLLPEDIELKSEPVHVGTLPTTTYAYASQEHDLGRISFYDSDSEALETITGFELNSEIEHD